jgi:hypothetical protein
MKKQISCLVLSAMLLLAGGCVRRTVTVDYQNRGTSGKRAFGSSKEGKLVEEKTIWIWQKEFRNP